MKIKIPKQIKVSSFVYELVLAENLARDHQLLGQCLSDSVIMTIDSKTSPQTKDVTLLHEIVHAINDVYNCGLEEPNIDRIAHGLADVLKNSFNIELDWEGLK